MINSTRLSTHLWLHRHWLHYGAVAALGLALFLPGLGSRDLWNPDEPRYAEVAREMLLTGEYFVPHLNGHVYTQKPPLQFWSMAASSFVTGGMNEEAARLPAALAVVGTLLLTFWLGMSLFGRRAAWIAVAILATSLKILWQGRIGQIDMLLCFIVALSVASWIKGELTGRTIYHRLFFLATGFATLAKGPAGFLPPLFAILAYYGLAREWKAGVRRLRPFLGLLIYLLPVLAWLVPAGLRAGPDYLEQIVFKQNVTRYADPWHHYQPWYYYFTVIPADFFPWALLLPTGLWVGWKALWDEHKPVGPRWRGSLRRAEGLSWTPWRENRAVPAGSTRLDSARPRYGFFFCLLWVGVTLLFFSLSPAKRTVYILSMYPGMALAMAAGLDRLIAGWNQYRGARRWLLIPLGFLAGLLALIAAAVVPFAARRPEASLFPEHLPGLLAACVATAAAGALGAFLLARAGRPGRGIAALAAGTALGVLGVVLLILPHFDRVKSARPLVERYLALSSPDEPYAIYPRLDAPILFYSERFSVPVHGDDELAAFAARDEKVWLFIERNQLEKLEEPLPLVEVARDGDPVDGYLLMTTPPGR